MVKAFRFEGKKIEGVGGPFDLPLEAFWLNLFNEKYRLKLGEFNKTTGTEGLRLIVFGFHSVPFQSFQSHNSYKCFIDVFEINSPFISTHNKCIINRTPNVMVCWL